jgi:hypothetical protein
MDQEAAADEDRVLSVQLDVDLDRQPVRGCLRTSTGAEEPFVGWLGFVEALGRLHERETYEPRRRT